MALRDT